MLLVHRNSSVTSALVKVWPQCSLPDLRVFSIKFGKYVVSTSCVQFRRAWLEGRTERAAMYAGQKRSVLQMSRWERCREGAGIRRWASGVKLDCQQDDISSVDGLETQEHRLLPQPSLSSQDPWEKHLLLWRKRVDKDLCSHTPLRDLDAIRKEPTSSLGTCVASTFQRPCCWPLLGQRVLRGALGCPGPRCGLDTVWAGLLRSWRSHRAGPG